MRDPALSVNHVRSPSELLYGLEYSSCKEDGPLSVVAEEFTILVAVDTLSVEVILVVNEIDLHACCRNRCNLDYERSVYIVDDDVHSRKTDHFMELIFPFIYTSVPRHEG